MFAVKSRCNEVLNFWQYPIMKTSKIIKKIKKSPYLLRNRLRRFLRRMEKILFREMKEQDIRNFWGYLGSFEVERSREEEFKMFLFAVSIFFLTTLIASGNFLFTDHFRIFYKMTNAQAMEVADLELSENEKLSTDVESVNKYKLKSPEEICADDKNKKQTSSLCGKDDEEELQKIAEEEKREIAKKTAKRKPVITAPKPYVYEVENGRRVCNKKNDKPSKSDKNKKGHMDMECCLDPDEVPNPNCYYNPSKYGKYL
jgi:hypothetical protein